MPGYYQEQKKAVKNGAALRYADIVAKILEKLIGLKCGKVEIIVKDGSIFQISRMEVERFDS